MEPLTYRAASHTDIPECVALRGMTRENAVSVERLASIGITVESWALGVEAGELHGFVCVDQSRIVGYAFGDRRTGEVVVVALLPTHEGRGIGRNVLARVVSDLATAGFERLHLTCSSDSKHRSHGFYRHLGWVATGRVDGHGDEILELDVAGPRPMPDTSVECTRGG